MLRPRASPWCWLPEFGSTRVCTELEARGSLPFFQRLTPRLFVLRLDTGRMVLFLFGFKI